MHTNNLIENVYIYYSCLINTLNWEVDIYDHALPISQGILLTKQLPILVVVVVPQSIFDYYCWWIDLLPPTSPPMEAFNADGTSCTHSDELRNFEYWTTTTTENTVDTFNWLKFTLFYRDFAATDETWLKWRGLTKVTRLNLNFYETDKNLIELFWHTFVWTEITRSLIVLNEALSSWWKTGSKFFFLSIFWSSCWKQEVDLCLIRKFITVDHGTRFHIAINIELYMPSIIIVWSSNSLLLWFCTIHTSSANQDKCTIVSDGSCCIT